MINRKDNCIPAVILFCFLMLLNQSACRAPLPEAQQKEQTEIKKRIQLAAAGGKHGYVVATYIIGRIKTAFLPDGPVNIEIIKMNLELLEKPMQFFVDDSTSYELIYRIGEKETKRRGYFGQILKTDHFELLISLKNNEKQENDSLLKTIDNLVFELKTYQY